MEEGILWNAIWGHWTAFFWNMAIWWILFFAWTWTCQDSSKLWNLCRTEKWVLFLMNTAQSTMKGIFFQLDKKLIASNWKSSTHEKRSSTYHKLSSFFSGNNSIIKTHLENSFNIFHTDDLNLRIKKLYFSSFTITNWRRFFFIPFHSLIFVYNH